jgi:hypothetical protein
MGFWAGMLKSEEYRANAAACAKLAMTVSDPEAKLAFASMASGWLRLADFVALNGENKQTSAGGPDSEADNKPA